MKTTIVLERKDLVKAIALFIRRERNAEIKSCDFYDASEYTTLDLRAEVQVYE